MDDIVVDLTRHGIAGDLIRRHLASEPRLLDALRKASAHVVVVEPNSRSEGAPFFESVQHAIAAAESAVPAGACALFVAYTSVPTIAETDAFDLRRGPTRKPLVRMKSRIGEFAGYVAIGEGGVVFFGEDGRPGVPPTEKLLALVGG